MNPKHIQIVGMLLLASGALELLEGVSFGLAIIASYFAIGGSWVTLLLEEVAHQQGGPFQYLPLLTGSLTLVLALVLGSLQLAGGWGVYKRKPWGRTVAIIACVAILIDCIRFPLAIYGLVVLFKLKDEFRASGSD